MAELLEALLRPVRYNRVTFLAFRAFWHGCLREDWTEDQFDAAIREIYELRAGHPPAEHNKEPS